MRDTFFEDGDLLGNMDDFRLGDWWVSPERLLLEREGELRQIGAKVMATLACLAAAEGQTVTKNTLIERVWQGAYTSDEALTTVIYELRKALGDDGRNPTFIGTVRGRGYRLLLPILPPESPEPHALEPTVNLELHTEEQVSISRQRSRPTPGRLVHRATSLGVAASAALLMTLLMTMGGTTSPVNWNLESPGLASTPEPAPLAKPLAEALRVGDELLDDSPESARRFFDFAIEQQPSLALAHARKAESFLQSARSEPEVTRLLKVEEARNAAGVALELDASSASAHASLGAIAFFHDGDPSAAEHHFAAARDWTTTAGRSVELPSPFGLAAYGSYLSATGRHDDAIAILDRVVEEKPQSVSRRLDLGRALYFARRYDTARQHLEQLYRLDPNEVRVTRLQIDVDLADGRREDAIKACQQALALAGADDDVTAELATVYRTAGLLGVLRCLEEELATRSDVDTLHLARYGAQSGDVASALRWLAAALQQNHPDLPWLDHDPAFDLMRSDPRFIALLDAHDRRHT